jgi:hypothetical protein
MEHANKMDEIEAILVERGKTHGLFADNARICMILRRGIRAAPGWDKLNDQQQLAMEETMLKIARAVSLDVSNEGLAEALKDIIGYNKLALNSMNKDPA